jgi:apolipoprotein N-acyltransferase
LLIGGYGYTGGHGHGPEDNMITNTFFIFQTDGVVQPNPYFKTALLAFGEYIPFGDVFPKLYDWIPASHFGRGPGPTAKTVPLPNGQKLVVGPQICYEGLFYRFSRALAQQDAEIFVNLTNDSWYGDWQEPFQHLYETLGRAVEFRRPLIRSTNTGITLAILADGTLLEQSPIFKEWSTIYDVPYRKNPRPTLYQLCPWLLHALFAAMVAFLVYKRRAKES